VNVNEFALECYKNAIDHGWGVDDEGNVIKRNFGEIVALCHSELSEALEEWRKGLDANYVYYRESDGKPEGIPFEMADVVIRVFDWFVSEGLDIEAFLSEKHEFNRTRPFRHGGKVA
jgi:hypothetical protein